MVAHPRLIVIWILILSLALQWGCASAPAALPLPPSEQVRARLGTIGVVSARFVPEAEFRTPARGGAAGAGRGIAKGIVGAPDVVADVLGPCAGEGCLPHFLLLFPTLAIGAMVGGISGAAEAEPTSKLEEAEAALRRVLAELNIQQAIRDRIVQVARAETRHLFVPLSAAGPTAPDEEVSYRSLASEGVDTVLEVGVQSLGLAGERGANPPLVLMMTVRTKLVRTTDGTNLYGHILRYSSRSRKFSEWAVDDAQPFREEFDRSYQALAEQIVEELFLLYLPREPRASPD